MAKKGTTKAKDSTAVSTGVVQTDDNAERKEFANKLKVAYYEAFKKQSMLDMDAMVKLIADNETDKPMAKEWWFDLMQKAEKPKAMATPRVESTNAIVDILSKDDELAEVSASAAAAGDLPPRAPAHIAFMLVRDHAVAFNGDTRKARQFIVNNYADPGSKMEKGTDGWGNTIGDNEKADYFWDYADRGAGVVSWFAEKLVDCLPAGIAINKIRTALRDKVDQDIVFDGVTIRPATMPSSQRTKATEQADNRRSRLITAHRDAVDVIRQWHEIETRLGVKRNENGVIVRDDQGNAVDVGRVAVDWAWLDDANMSLGLSPTKSIIVVRNILQDGERKGELGAAFYPYTAAQFINLSVDMAITNAAKAGRGLEKVSIIDLTSSKREKKAPTTAKQKEAQAKKAAEMAAKVTAQRVPDWISKMFDWTENEDNFIALLHYMNNNMAQEQLQLFQYKVWKVVGRLDKKLITPDTEKVAKQVEAKLVADKQKEIDAKALATAEQKTA